MMTLNRIYLDSEIEEYCLNILLDISGRTSRMSYKWPEVADEMSLMFVEKFKEIDVNLTLNITAFGREKRE